MLRNELHRRELTESRERIEAELSRPCRVLAYPYGEHDARCRAAARAAGYEASFGLPAFGARETVEYTRCRVGLFRRDGRVDRAGQDADAGRRLAVASGLRRGVPFPPAVLA